MSPQEKIVMAVLREGLPLDQRIALRQYNIKALSTVICALRKNYGFKFAKTYHPDGRRLLVRYSLEE